MRRRQFIAGLGTAVTWPAIARAQQRSVPVIGLLSTPSAEGSQITVVPFREGLQKTGGYIEGRNVAIDYRFAENRVDLLPELAADLVRRRVAVIAAFGDAAALAAKAATTTIPIAFVVGSDPVSLGLVRGFDRPAGNATGFANLRTVLMSKRLQILREIVPNARLIGLLVNPASPNTELDTRDLMEGAAKLGQEIVVLNASNDGELEAAFATFAAQRVSGIVVGGDAFYNRRTEQIAAWTTRYALPTICPYREYAVAGGLISYGISFDFSFRQLGVFVGRILQGANPADLPVEQATRVDLTLNLRTAKALGLSIPETLLATADEVIQ